MQGLQWLGAHWFDALSAIGIVGGLFFSGNASLKEAKARRFANHLDLAKNLRELMLEAATNPAFDRIFKTGVDLKSVPLTLPEEIFVAVFIQHLNLAFHGTRDKLVNLPEQLTKDIMETFSLPIPKAGWEQLRPFQDKAFVRFMDESLK